MLGEYSRYFHTCQECRIRYCREVCPMYKATRNESHCSNGFNMAALAVYKHLDNMSLDLAMTLSHCTTCGACQYRCPNTLFGGDFYKVTMPTPEIVETMREDLVNAGYELSAHKKLFEKWHTFLNPYGEPARDRNRWIPSEYSNKLYKKAPYVYFAGCTAALREPEIAASTVKIMDYFGIDFTVMQEEPCCGSVLLRAGYKKQAKKLAEDNIARFKEMDAEKIVTSCGGCYRTFKVDYPRIAGDMGLEVLHVSELLAQLPQAKEVKKLEGKVTYHDPCHLGRGGVGLFEPPREVIRNLGLDLVEMNHTLDNANCCGAGGGAKSALPDLAVKIAKSRIEEAEQTGASILMSTCPFCKRNLMDAAKEMGSKIEVRDLTEVFARAL